MHSTGSSVGAHWLGRLDSALKGSCTGRKLRTIEQVTSGPVPKSITTEKQQIVSNIYRWSADIHFCSGIGVDRPNNSILMFLRLIRKRHYVWVRTGIENAVTPTSRASQGPLDSYLWLNKYIYPSRATIAPDPQLLSTDNLANMRQQLVVRRSQEVQMTEYIKVRLSPLLLSNLVVGKETCFGCYIDHPHKRERVLNPAISTKSQVTSVDTRCRLAKHIRPPRDPSDPNKTKAMEEDNLITRWSNQLRTLLTRTDRFQFDDSRQDLEALYDVCVQLQGLFWYCTMSLINNAEDRNFLLEFIPDVQSAMRRADRALGGNFIPAHILIPGYIPGFTDRPGREEGLDNVEQGDEAEDMADDGEMGEDVPDDGDQEMDVGDQEAAQDWSYDADHGDGEVAEDDGDQDEDDDMDEDDEEDDEEDEEDDDE
ncbi:hypothetical protein QBC37DRAFT_405421 [Rhypophila decipiens]|uniref:Uncharacterized protein n=1 Tax=Rhypophila decipiens TaxID=261697 RepID=A0AAN6XYZ2_9PEZI|nr:hypothetical protein QBC37DRAFT_405421 [Rhypophila decipiens]